jgi:hypothetical protein
MKYIYFEADNPAPFINWLRNYPAERYIVMFGSSTVMDIDLVVEALTKDLELAQWLMDQILIGHIRLMTIKNYKNL